MAQQRLTKELHDIESNPPKGISAAVMDEDVFEWLAKIEGAPGGQNYDLSLHMPKDYPSSPPKIGLVTKVKHSKVDANGAIDLEVLTKEGWRQSGTVRDVLEEIRDMLRG
ncbi:hypothetical protein DOTSEDRAFT_28767 [Dothistroma septosporum NZE10]|uniref:UBC core domain-containing protein n=1 Tax=Dothistroma septosporum (strain NZE10 / CBS 128990) TaxID=675120 RepID=M2WKY3_DOTSN|nr:hypothetical protein DOTSEDRAFT_28767 [Dothistroma septosporum NZE10]